MPQYETCKRFVNDKVMTTFENSDKFRVLVENSELRVRF